MFNNLAMELSMGFRFVFVVSCLTLTMIGTVHLRVCNSHSFYRLQRAKVVQSRFLSELWQKQLQMANLTSPEVISQRFDCMVAGLLPGCITNSKLWLLAKHSYRSEPGHGP